MRVWTEVVGYWDGEKYVMDESRSVSFDYDGPVASCKGDDTAKQMAKDSAAMSKEAFQFQMDSLKKLQMNFSKFMTDPEGFAPADLSAMTSSALNDNSLAFNQAGSSIRDQITAMGGSGDLPVSGNTIGRLSGLAGMAASTKASTLNNINIMNAQQKLANQFNAGSLLSGNAATLTGTQGAQGSLAGSALNSYIQSKNQGFGAAFTHALGSSLGAGIGGLATGGLGGALSGGGMQGFNIGGKG